jgi:hypothetical protein
MKKETFMLDPAYAPPREGGSKELVPTFEDIQKQSQIAYETE